MLDMSWPWAVFILEWAVRLALLVRVLLQGRPTPVALAWVMLLLFVPFVGLLFYLLIGENRLGSRRARRYHELTEGMDQRIVKLWHHREEDWAATDETWHEISKLATAVSGLPPLKGNALRLINTSEAMLGSLARDIDEASLHCHLLFYIYTTTPACLPVSESLMRAARRGVACRLLVDAVGSRRFLGSRVCHDLRAAGVKVEEAMPANPVRMLFARIDLRNHRKIAVIDGQIAYTGSHNVIDSTFRAGWNRRTGPWVDASVRMTGPAAQVLQIVFLKDWLMDSEEKVDDIEPFIPPIQKKPDQSQVVQVIPSGPGDTAGALQQALLSIIYAAREELIITTPYFVPDDATKHALQAAAVRGVQVTLVMPLEVDSPLVAAASRSHWQDLLESGVRILQYGGGLLHAKTLTADRRIGMIGSANFDARSFWLNFEITLLLYDDDFTSVLRFMQTGYMEHSQEVALVAWRGRSKLKVLAQNTAQLLGPLL
jgi:cardiolipin synthase